MLQNIGIWIGVIGGIAGLVVLFAGLARGSYYKAKIEQLRGDLDDSRKREDDRQRDVDLLKSNREVDHAKIEGLIRENTVLKDLVTQRVEIGALQDMLEQHHAEANTHWEKTEDMLERLLTFLTHATDQAEESSNDDEA